MTPIFPGRGLRSSKAQRERQYVADISKLRHTRFPLPAVIDYTGSRPEKIGARPLGPDVGAQRKLTEAVSKIF